jgi:GxxExxY protein
MLLDDSRLNDVTGTILAGAIEVHRVLGPGLFESTYGPCLQFELQARGLSFLVQPPIDVVYKSLQLQSVYRADLIVADMVVVEIKAVETLTSLHKIAVIDVRTAGSQARGAAA